MTSGSARLILIRHGDTDWITGNKHASRTEVPLSKTGEQDVEMIRDRLVGAGGLIDPHNVAKIYCSPRISARRTVEILQLGIHNHQHFIDRSSAQRYTNKLSDESSDPYIQITKGLEEWDYGEYEGMTLHDIQEIRSKNVAQKATPWDIWTEGCPGGESPQQVSDRLDELITEIKSVMQSNAAAWPSGQIVSQRGRQAQDVVCIGHGHILSAMALRWIGLPLQASMLRLGFEPGGVGVLGFEHDNLNQPAIVLGRRPGRSDRAC